MKRPPDVLHSANATEAVKKTARFTRKGFGHLGEAVTRIYRDGGGVRAFWVGNGLNVTKIFPVSRFSRRVVTSAYAPSNLGIRHQILLLRIFGEFKRSERRRVNLT